jgi:hypothetical protein
MNRFWNFVQNFWTPEGGYDYCDEWQSSGNFYSTLNFQKGVFKTSFPYKLKLNFSFKRNKKYTLIVYLEFNCSQKYLLDNKDVTSKKQGIRQALQIIKEFESNKSKIKEVWNKTIHKIPKVNEKGEWIATNIIGGDHESLYTSNIWAQTHIAPLGYGTFYKLKQSTKDKTWYWTKINISGFGYSSCSIKNVDDSIWLAVIGFDPELDEVLNKALCYRKNNKLVMLSEEITGKAKAKLLLEEFCK